MRNLGQMLSSSVLRAAPEPPPRRMGKIIGKGGEPELPAAPIDGLDRVPAHPSRRRRIWEFDNSLHCSIIGTCLTTAELRHILAQVKIGGTGTLSDHQLHAVGVTLAGRQDEPTKLLQKALDRRHRAKIHRYSTAKDPVSLLTLWRESLEQGDIPGAYWAALTHPAATDDIIKKVFGDVHMLSHLVGAANRADLRRLRRLEQENAGLAAKIQRQQSHLRDGFAARDRTIDHLNKVLARRDSERPHYSQEPSDSDALNDLICDLNKRLASETARREHSEQRLSELSVKLSEKHRALQISQREREEAYQELESVENHLAALARPETYGVGAILDLCGFTLLYVGGRPHQIPQLKRLTERTGASFLYHDGGIEHSSALLPGLLSRSDYVFFPIDCISHDAAMAIKRLCGQTGKRYRPLRTASLACLFSGLAREHGSGRALAAE
jgi:hypothetical protein